MTGKGLKKEATKVTHSLAKGSRKGAKDAKYLVSRKGAKHAKNLVSRKGAKHAKNLVSRKGAKHAKNLVSRKGAKDAKNLALAKAQSTRSIWSHAKALRTRRIWSHAKAQSSRRMTIPFVMPAQEASAIGFTDIPVLLYKSHPFFVAWHQEIKYCKQDPIHHIRCCRNLSSAS